MISKIIIAFSVLVTFTYVFLRIQSYINNKTKNENHFLLMIAISHSLLSVIAVLVGFRYKGIFIDLRSIPILILTYSLGWKYGLISVAVGIIYQVYFGDSSYTQYSLFLILVPYIIGAVFHNISNQHESKKNLPRPMDFNSMLIPLIIELVIHSIILRGKYNLDSNIFFRISIFQSSLSFVTYLILMSLINDIIYKNIYKKDSDNLKDSLKRISESSTDAIVIHRMGKIHFINQAGVKLIGANNSEEIVNRMITDFVYDESMEIVNERILNLNNKTSYEPYQLLAKKVNGESVEIEFTRSTINFDGDFSTMLIIRNITEHKERERELRRLLDENRFLLDQTIQYDNLKTEFFSNISHEFKTPLNIILGGIQLIDKTIENSSSIIEREKFKNNIKIIIQNCYRLLRLINNLIDITRFDGGYMKLNTQNYDIVKVVEDITLSVVEYAKNNNIEVIFDTDIEERVIAFDIEKIERVVLNLLSNSIKFINLNGKIEVSVSDRGEWIEISVKDNGIGIPEEKLNSIFERFRQVDPLMTRTREGSGIGLSLVKTIVEAHDGKIHVNSKVGEGSEFIVILPVRINKGQGVIDEVAATAFKNSKIERINIEFSDIYK